MKITQSRHANRIRFEFGKEELSYTIADGSGSRSFSVPYIAISRDRQTLEERNDWLRHVGLLWLALGAVLTIIDSLQKGRLALSIWLLVGAGCYAAYRLRSTRFTILPSDQGNILVIDNADGPRIISELESRRAQQFLRRYDFCPPDDSIEQIQNRYRWLHREGALTNEQLQSRLAGLEAPGPSGEEAEPSTARLLN
ncbi:MAG: hypothetical protein AB7V26_06420 [Lysobacterales bacterium]